MFHLFIAIELGVASIGLTIIFLIWRRDGGLHRLTNKQFGVLGGFAVISAVCGIIGFFV